MTDRDLASHVVRYYDNLMTRKEQLALRHLVATAKLTHGRTDAKGQAEAMKRAHPIRRDMVSDD